MYQIKDFLTIKNCPLNNKKVFLRADLNVPLNNGTIVDDFRLQSIIPTLDYLLKKNCTIILATHIGRPKNNESTLSTKILIPWFEQRGYSIVYEPDLTKAQQHPTSSTIILLENLRFFAGEKDSDTTFAKQLAKCAEYYVNDAFAVSHRNDTSITLLPTLFPSNKRTIGLLIENELTHLNKLLINPKNPYTLVLGGGKVTDKLPIITAMLEKIDRLLLCPALVYSFLAAQHKPTGKSLVDTAALETIKKIVDKAEKNNVALYEPLDYQVALDTLDGPLCYVDAQKFPANAIGTSIGPKTVTAWSTILNTSETIFFNAGMGFADRPETWVDGKALLDVIAKTNAYSVVGGGSSVALVRDASLQDSISFLSTGGGATLNYLAGKPLPGLQVLINRTKS